MSAQSCARCRAPRLAALSFDPMRETGDGENVRTLDRFAEFVKVLSGIAHEKLGQFGFEVASHALELGRAIEPGKVDRARYLRLALGRCLDRCRWR